MALVLHSASTCQTFHTLSSFLVCSWFLRIVSQECWQHQLESSAACERLAGYIFTCVLLVMFYLSPQQCMSSTGVLTNSVEVISNNS